VPELIQYRVQSMYIITMNIIMHQHYNLECIRHPCH